jgi:hypothetical protein
MSLMGWSSESMAARYQHVTDAIRTDVASQVGDLIWQVAGNTDEPELVLVRRESLAAVLSFTEQRASERGGRQAPGQAGLLAAIGDLRASLASGGAGSATSNETKTETRAPERP